MLAKRNTSKSNSSNSWESRESNNRTSLFPLQAQNLSLLCTHMWQETGDATGRSTIAIIWQQVLPVLDGTQLDFRSTPFSSSSKWSCTFCLPEMAPPGEASCLASTVPTSSVQRAINATIKVCCK
ncbi:hypothetical protein ACLKA7_015037 [Drosophila subpalustris]